jgi:cation/acetate symporter
MIYDVAPLAIILFFSFVAFVIGLSIYFAKKTKSSKSYFAAGGTIPWGVNGIAFAGDYLSAASFLGICGLIATAGYDGFLYSIGFLAGWVVALFIVAEPMKRMGEYTFADAIDSRFNSRSIQLMAAISTLVVSICYLIPQMVGAGDLVTPLLGLPHWAGVLLVGVIVVIIVSTAGMTSTTYVQFLKGGLLIVFSLILVTAVLLNGLSKDPGEASHKFVELTPVMSGDKITGVTDPGYSFVGEFDAAGLKVVKLEKLGVGSWWSLSGTGGSAVLKEALSLEITPDGKKLFNGEPRENRKFYPVGHLSILRENGKDIESTGPVGPFRYLSILAQSEVVTFKKSVLKNGDVKVTLWTQKPVSGERLLRPGTYYKIDAGATTWNKLNFISLMLALFFGTAALPHVLIRYYTVPNAAAARKSTILAIAAIGLFYVLTLFMGLGAMTSGVMDVQSSNMAAPLLAKSIGLVIFALISAIAFATVLGTVSGLIVASSGAVAHDLITNFMQIKLTDKGKVMAGKIAAVTVGAIAIGLGILFKGMNVSYLVGLAFAVAASANLPAIIMLLFWKGTTGQGIAASILVGMVSSVVIIVLSPSIFSNFGLGTAPMPLDNPAIFSVPLSVLTLVVVSLLTKKKKPA